MRQWIKVLAVNLGLILAVLVGFELVFGNWISTFRASLSTDPTARFTDAYYDSVYVVCPDRHLHHKYCPSISHRHQMAPEDGGETVVSYVNKSGIRVRTPAEMNGETAVESYDVINLGDSFMQADELPLEKTLSSVMERDTGKKVVQVGFGSWAPLVEYNWLKQQQLKPGVVVNLFVGINDVTPHYDRSNLSYYRDGHKTPSGHIEFADFGLPISPELRHLMAENSILYRLLLRLRLRLIEQQLPAPNAKAETLARSITEPESDCARLSSYKNVEPMAFDYVVFAFADQCWPDNVRAEVRSVVDDIRKMKGKVDTARGRLNIILVPGGWIFSDEVVHGKTSPRYRMAADAALTSTALGEYLSRELAPNGVRVIDTEPLLKQWKAEKGGLFYFSTDGHWNARTHEFLGHWLARAIDASGQAGQIAP